MDDKCQVQVDTSSSIPVIHLRGEITTFADETINGAFSLVVTDDFNQAVLDFSSVTYVNSAGIAILVSLVTETKKKQGRLYFSGLAPHYKRVMEIVGITEYVDLYDTVEQALAEAED